MKTLVWRGLDEPRMEIAYVSSFERAHGTQVGLAYELRWALEDGSLHFEIVGNGERALELGDCDFFDLAYSPFFNSLPVVRDRLFEHGPTRGYRMRFVSVPELEDEVVDQQYSPLGDGVVRYASGSFEANIEFDRDGFVTLYQDFLERLA